MQGIDKLSNRTMGLIVVAGVIVSYYFYKKKQNDNKEDSQLKILLGDGVSSKAAEQAQRIHKALALNWLWSVQDFIQGTDTATILKVAKEITDISAVMNSYAALYKGANMFEDIESCLSVENFENFKRNIKTGANLGTVETSLLGKKVNVYSDRTLYYDAAFLKTSGTKAKKGQFHIQGVSLVSGTQTVKGYKISIIDKSKKNDVPHSYWIKAEKTDTILNK